MGTALWHCWLDSLKWGENYRMMIPPPPLFLSRFTIADLVSEFEQTILNSWLGLKIPEKLLNSKTVYKCLK